MLVHHLVLQRLRQVPLPEPLLAHCLLRRLVSLPVLTPAHYSLRRLLLQAPLQELLRRCLAFRPQERPSAEEVATELQRLHAALRRREPKVRDLPCLRCGCRDVFPLGQEPVPCTQRGGADGAKDGPP